MRTVVVAAAIALIGPLAGLAGQSSKDSAFTREFQRLRQGRTYTAQKSGTVRSVHRSGPGIGVEHHYAVTVPDSYDPARSYPARIQLHGGVMMRRSNVPPANAGSIGALAGDEPSIYIVPFAWDASPWWSSDGVRNLHDILEAVKRDYNVDENRVVLSGVSDGGTGAYYTAMRDTTPYAAFLPLNGFWGVLANRDISIDGPLYPNNLRDKPFFIVNGERDPLYPTSIVDPAVAHYRRIGMTVDYRPQAGAGHNTQWWPTVKASFESFAREHVRQPLPDVLTWETADATTFNRAHWLVIDALGTAAGESTLDDPNLMTPASHLDFGARSMGNRINFVVPGSNADKIGIHAGDGLVRINGESVRMRMDVNEIFEDLPRGAKLTLLVARDNAPVELEGVYEPVSVVDPPAPVFDHSKPSGRVDLKRAANTIDVKTRGVTRFTLLISPDQFDFDKPITVVVNGRTVHNSRVVKDVTTLQKWAAIDNDRTMLFGAEIAISLRP